METKKTAWSELFGGTEPNMTMKKMILQEVADTGKDIREIVAKYSLPEMAIVNRDGKFHDIKTGRMLTPEEWHEMSPLGPYAKLIIVREKDL